jgi:stage II sporulation protein D
MVFTRTSIKPLSGAACKWCTDPKLDNKYKSWKLTLARGTIAHRLEKAAKGIPELGRLRRRGRIYALEIADRAEHGRITRFRVRFDYDPGSAELWANDVRLALGPNQLRSTNCRIATNADKSRYYFAGSGWGHGVGLCQWGSLGMARAGYDYQDILAHYFPYSRIIRMVYEENQGTEVAKSSTAVPAPRRSSPRRSGGADERPKG